MKGRILLQIFGEGGDITIKEIQLENYTFYAYFTEENYDGEEFKNCSPFYHSFWDLWSEFPFPVFELYPNLKIELDQDIKEIIKIKFDNYLKDNSEEYSAIRDWKFLLN
jgi:hypothetical protein